MMAFKYDLLLNKTEYEERKMYFIEYYAIIVPKEKVLNFLKEKSNEIPSYLKKAKKYDETRIAVLYKKVEKDVEMDKKLDIIKVKVPGFQPLTREQIEDAVSLWPCTYLRRPKIKIDFNKEKAIEFVLKLRNEIIIANKEEVVYNSKLVVENMHSKFAGCLKKKGELKGILFRTQECSHEILKAVSYVSKVTLGYLCTGLFCFLEEEPCYSCGMALLHGRIKAVFIKKRKSKGIFSFYKFNHNKNTNHRFHVYFIEEKVKDE